MKKITTGWAALMAATTVALAATDYSATIRELSPWITNQLQATGASSLALVLVDGTQVVWTAGFGFADPITGRTADADTIYGIGSVSKTFTALAAMRGVDRGELSLDAPVTNWVPTFRFQDRFPGAPPITPRLLMNHQSGLPGDYIPYAQTTVPDLRFGVEVLAGMADEYPVYSPNFSDTYNNNGFTLMESVVAAFSGTSFVAQVTADVLQPLGMTNSAFLLRTNQFSGRLARSMVGADAYPDEVVNVHASGGLYSSANEMGRVIEMLLGGGIFRGQRFLSTNALAAMWTLQSTNVSVHSADSDFQAGLGWDNVADPNLAYAGRACFKDGDTACFHAMIEIMPEHGLGVAVIANGGGAAVDIAQRALRLALRDKFGLPLPTNAAPFPDSPVVLDPPLPWDQIAGYYARAGGVACVTAANGYLTLYPNAFDATVSVCTNLAPHTNGWFWEAGNTNLQVAFTNVFDHLLLMARSNRGRYWNMSIIGERIAPAVISEAWLERTAHAWISADLDPFNFLWAQNAVKPNALLETNGFLFFNNFAFGPTNDHMALPFIAGRNDAGALKVVETNGEEWLRLQGSHFRSVDALPVMAAPGVTNATLAGDMIGWYHIPRSGSGRLEFRLAGAPLPQLRVLNADFSLMETIQPAAGRILVAPTGAVFAAVTLGPEGGNAYTLHAFWRRVAADYDGDGKADPAVYGSTETLWGVSYSSSGYAQNGSLIVGQPAGTTVAEDYDGDGKMDPAVYCAADGVWTVAMSASNYTVTILTGFGAADAIPVPADYDGDGKADPACYRAADGTWAFKPSAGNYETTLVNNFGGPDCSPVPADYDGDGKADPAIYRAADGIWAVGFSGSGYMVTILNGFGAADAIPVPADYDGDGKADPACYRAADGTWAFKPSAGNYETTLVNNFGGPDCSPVPADYDGDGKADPTCYRTVDGTWGCMLSARGYATQTLSFGGPGYQPAW
ncbi:MAG: serine hydrolase [Verrucomicrobia bacterium]|nr:serine hydrolase [Verrucomicrobiota bacterium]MBU4247396.1 serine hydrolase [Verrucomicrobiota bacterium]MBU4292124.1 serine hydrolase [Verrucomicrobiota bacterium]MBU4498201.1 serine hydrolase [Verrucomicrobiota bacterium]MCG2681401.1 serine hydrolase [Kiritimatiellia bacterium]